MTGHQFSGWSAVSNLVTVWDMYSGAVRQIFGDSRAVDTGYITALAAGVVHGFQARNYTAIQVNLFGAALQPLLLRSCPCLSTVLQPPVQAVQSMFSCGDFKPTKVHNDGLLFT